MAAKVSRDERRMNALLAVENGNYVMVEDYKKLKERNSQNLFYE